MCERPMESLKRVADQLARLIVSGSKDSEKIRTLEQKMGFLNDESKASRTQIIANNPASAYSTLEERVGIWKASIKRGKKYFVRDRNYQNDFALWANVQKIPPKGVRRRIVLLGESVARGFLFDPYFNPASFLASILNKEFDPYGAEVVDLAKTDILIDELKEICSSSLLLKPDAVVVFAGNNWLNAIELSDDDIEQMMKVMDTEVRFKGLKSILEKKYKVMVADFVKHTATLFKNNNIPWVLIIPEFNLLDWKSNAVQQILLWPGREVTEWWRLKQEAMQAIASGDLNEAERLIQEMIELNEGTPIGYELMAECKIKCGQLNEARHFLELAQDTSMFRLTNVPGSISIIRNTMREEASRYQIPMVDLPAEFERFQSNGIPGKELFIDYCHLTVEGIQIAMASTAQKLIFLMKNKEIPVENLKKMGNSPDIDVKARAHFFAAIHNAHKGQSYENLYYHCSQAVNLSPSVTKLFLNYIDMASRHVPWSLSRSCEALVGCGELSQYTMLLQPYTQHIMDIELVNAMVAALKRVGINVKDKIDTLRINEHGLQNGKINLLESYYHYTSYITHPIITNGYYWAFEPESCFFLVAENSMDVKLQLTCRAPNIDTHEAKLSITVNNSHESQLTLNVHRNWKTYSLHLFKTSIKRGINRIVIKWPLNLNLNGNRSNGGFSRKKIDLLKNALYPVYGEIHMFTAKKIEKAAL